MKKKPKIWIKKNLEKFKNEGLWKSLVGNLIVEMNSLNTFNFAHSRYASSIVIFKRCGAEVFYLKTCEYKNHPTDVFVWEKLSIFSITVIAFAA